MQKYSKPHPTWGARGSHRVFRDPNPHLALLRTPESPLINKRCVLALDFRYPDFFAEFYPDSGGYLEIFGPYPDYDIPQKNNFFF